MKRFITLVLALVMVLSLCACNASETGGGDAAEAGLQAGFSKVNITPDYPMPISGYSDNEFRNSADGSLIEYIYATCVAVKSGEDTMLIYTLDNLSVPLANARDYRSNISIATGIPDTHIQFGATHGHNCPEISGQYKTDMIKWLIQAGQEAIADLAPATMSAATPQFEGMTFVRHYKNDDGTYVGSNFGYWGNLVGHATEPDDTAVLVKFDREDAKKDILMVNWQSHPDSARTIGYYCIAPGFVGHLRDTIANQTDMLVAYWTGASGNQNPDSKIESEAHNLIWSEYGDKMGELIVGQLDTLQPVGGSGIKIERTMFDVPINHDWDHMINEANEVYDLWKSTDKTTGDVLAKTYDFSSVYQARAIRTRFSKGASEELELNVFSIGDLGFIVGTFEMFTDTSLYVKENSPYDITFIITGNNTYIPSREAYEVYRCYESDTGYYAAGTAESIATKFVEMLDGIKG